MRNKIDSYRRKLLAGIAVGSASSVLPVATSITIANGVFLSEVKAETNQKPSKKTSVNTNKTTSQNKKIESEVAKDKKPVRWGMIVDTNKLGKYGADQMISACKREHGWGEDNNAFDRQQNQWIRKVNSTDKQTQYQVTLPMMCQHCDEPPCVDVCPTGSSYKREDGIVLVDKDSCIGCRYCILACPYDARSFVFSDVESSNDANTEEHQDRKKGTVESCNLCVHRVDKGRKPACASAAPQAVLFGDMNDKTSNISRALKKYGGTQVRSDLKLNTGVRYWGI